MTRYRDFKLLVWFRAGQITGTEDDFPFDIFCVEVSGSAVYRRSFFFASKGDQGDECFQ